MNSRSIFLQVSSLLCSLSLFASAAFAQFPMPPRPPGLPGLPDISGVIEGAISPGVYGRIDIGNSRPPPLIYAQPVIIHRPAVYIAEPLYLHVPPGHSKNWSKHCGYYNACGRQVYFVRVNGNNEYGRGEHRGEDYERQRERNKEDYERQRERSKKDYERGYRGSSEDGHGRGRGKKDHDD